MAQLTIRLQGCLEKVPIDRAFDCRPSSPRKLFTHFSWQHYERPRRIITRLCRTKKLCFESGFHHHALLTVESKFAPEGLYQRLLRKMKKFNAPARQSHTRYGNRIKPVITSSRKARTTITATTSQSSARITMLARIR